jgi:hypothetical protein
MSNRARRAQPRHQHSLRRKSDVTVGVWWFCNDPSCSDYGSHFDPAPASAIDHARAAIIVPRTAKGHPGKGDPSAIRSVSLTEDHNGVNGTR